MKHKAAHYVRPLLHGFSQQQLAPSFICTVCMLLHMHAYNHVYTPICSIFPEG